MYSVIFDMDGTLLDTQRICISAWEYAGRQQGFKGAGEHIPNVCGMNLNGSLKYIRDNFPGVDPEKFKEDSREYIERNGVVEYKDGAEELLKFLKANGIKIALATGTSRPSVMHHLKAVDAEKYFDAVICGGDVQNGKPAPDIFLLAAEKLGADPRDCIVLEDSANGINAAVAAGMRCIGIPDIVAFAEETKALLFAHCESMTEVLDILESY